MNQAGQDADLRVSDAERDAVVTQLGEHFEVGPLDLAEFDERTSAAMRARTRRELAVLLADLPSRQPPPSAPAPAPPAEWEPGHHHHAPLLLVPLIIAIVLAASLLKGGWHEPWYLALVIPVAVLRLRALRGRRETHRSRTFDGFR